MSDLEEQGNEAPLLTNDSASAGPSKTLLRSLRERTSARVGLRRAGTSLATAEILDFKLAHALARDAVHRALDFAAMTHRLQRELPWTADHTLPILTLETEAADRASYIRRPDLGRLLTAASAEQIHSRHCDVICILADGLSAVAVERHAIPLLSAMLPAIVASGWTCGPLCLVKNARVAIGDPIGLAANAKASVVLIGERPGLSSPDSLGAYLTWNPRPGRHDAERNCISNIREGGLTPQQAAARVLWYLREALSRQYTGFALKEQSDPLLPF